MGTGKIDFTLHSVRILLVSELSLRKFGFNMKSKTEQYKTKPEICSVDVRKKNDCVHLLVCLLLLAQRELCADKKKSEIRIPLNSMYSLSVFTNQEFYSIDTN